jgi:hypothetical protein
MPHYCNVTEMLDELRLRHAHAKAEIERDAETRQVGSRALLGSVANLRSPADCNEPTKRVEKIIDRSVAEQMGFVLDYGGPLRRQMPARSWRD